MYSVVNFFDADSLASKDGAEVNLFAPQTDPAAIGAPHRPVGSPTHVRIHKTWAAGVSKLRVESQMRVATTLKTNWPGLGAEMIV